jgi:poly(3-hydroxybutyrate) depolymerase
MRMPSRRSGWAFMDLTRRQRPVWEAVGRLAKRGWCNFAGEARVAINMIAGMGHCTPIGDGLGTPGPSMLDTGISSTREIRSPS